MRSIIRIICLSAIAVTLLIPYYPGKVQAIAVRPVSPSGRQVTGDQWLFVIGIDTYIEWPRLNTAVNDAKSVKDVLLSRYHFNKDHLIELYDEQATRRNILGKLVYLAKNVRDDDSLVIYYAGHGNLDPITKSGSWIPVESSTNNVSAWISNHDIKNYLRVDAIKAKHILLISDSCFSGDFFRGHRGKLPEVTDRVIKRAYELTSRQAITSGGLEPVSDEGFGNNSVFSHFLVKDLKENQKPFLIPSDLFPGIKAGVAENAEQFPRFGSLKGTGGQQGGELVLFLKQDARLQTLSAQASARQAEFERLKQMEAAAAEAKQKEAAEIARREKELAALDSKIEGMRKRLGTVAVQTDDSLDAMLAMVRQKEEQENKLNELHRKRGEEERKRQAKIERLKQERDEKIVAMLRPEVEKYKEIVASKYGQSMKSNAWKSLIAKCPPGWADGVEGGDIKNILSSPETRKRIKDEKFLSYKNKKGWLGVGIQDISKQVAEHYGIKSRKGVLVTEVFPNGPADVAGIKPQYIILSINGKEVGNARELTSMIDNIGAGEFVKIKLLKNGRIRTFRVKIGKREDDETSARNTRKEYQEGLGLRVAEFTTEKARRLNIKKSKGVIVIDIKPGSKAAESGLRGHDIIKEINHKSIATVSDLNKVISEIQKGETINMFIWRMNRGYLVFKLKK